MRRYIIFIFIIGISLISIGSGLQLKKYNDSKKNDNVIFYSDNTSKKNFKTAKINLDQIKESTERVAEEVQVVENPIVTQPVRVWYNPTNNGYISNPMGYSGYTLHFGYDITSPLGMREVVYPIADGIITGVFYDSAGARIVTILHTVDGKNYTSMYVHMSSFAPNIKEGMNVTKDTPLGQMGMTGNATGVHLHLEVADCALFVEGDNNCSSIGGYYSYLRKRYNEGFFGARTLLNLPQSWSSR